MVAIKIECLLGRVESPDEFDADPLMPNSLRCIFDVAVHATDVHTNFDLLLLEW